MTTEEFENIARNLRPRLLAVGREFFGNDDMGNDVAQETLTRLWLMRDRADLLTMPEALAVRMAKNICVSEWRKQKVRRTVDIDMLTTTADTSPSPIADHDNNIILQRAVAQLGKTEQRLWRMRHEAGMDIAQIAAVTGIRPRSISAMLSAARRKLLEMVKRQGGL